MAITTIEQAMRSLKFAVMLTLNGYDPQTEFAHLIDLPREAATDRVQFISYPNTPNTQTLPCIHGPLGTILLPGVCVEYGKTPAKFGRVKLPLVLSLSRKLDTSPERDSLLLDQLCENNGVNDFVFNKQICPVYQFAPENDDIIDTAGTVSWFYNGTNYIQAPQVENVLEQNAGGFVRREYRMMVTFTVKPTLTAPEPQ